MKQKLLLVFLVALFTIYSSAQITNNPTVKSRNNNCDVLSVELTEQYTIVKIKVPKKHYKSASISSATILVPVDNGIPISEARQSNLGDFNNINLLPNEILKRILDDRKYLSDAGFLIRNLGNDLLDQTYKPSKGADHLILSMYFDRLSPGIEEFYIRELSRSGWEWYGIRIINPYPTVENTGYTENTIKQIIDKQNDGLTGIYQGLKQNDNQYLLGCIKDSDLYKLVYLGCKESLPQWHIGEVKAVLYPTASPSTFKMDYYMANKTKNSDCYVIFDNVTMKVFIDGDEVPYLKMYPGASNNGNSASTDWSGSGFAIGSKYVVTNYHVVENAKSINIQGIQGSFSTLYNATITAIDKSNDLAILKIDDPSFNGFGAIPYGIKTTVSDVGEDVFVLGYPLTSTMGDEIKLTTGVVSSRTGYQGDVSLYQISAPVQPGNSGGPLFDDNGNVIGIISAKHTGAESVGYAIKASYLNNILESIDDVQIPKNNTVSSLQLSEKVKRIKNYVFLISCSSK